METQGKIFILMGLKHSGKSSLARLLGKEFFLDTVDLDDNIARIARERFPELRDIGDTAACVRALYHAQGKIGFQQLETEAVVQMAVLSRQKPILALGGGTMENQSAMRTVTTMGPILFLDVPCAVLYRRIIRGGIPAFLDPVRPEEHFQEIFAQRRSAALTYATRVVQIDSQSIEEVFSIVKLIFKELMDAR